jgi:threonine aldolase
MSVCLSKGLGAPIGSVLIGSNDFIKKARRIRKALGGGMRQVGIIAAAGLFALDEFFGKESMIEKDHNLMSLLANSLQNAIAFRFDIPDTNILFMDIVLYDKKWNYNDISSKIGEMFLEKGILVSSWSPLKLRLVVHRNITDNNIQYVITCIHEISRRLETM